MIEHMEVWYQFKELVEMDGELRFVTPRADPMQFEYPFDYLYETVHEALDHLTNIMTVQEDEYKDWVLVRTAFTPFGSGEVPHLLEILDPE